MIQDLWQLDQWHSCSCIINPNPTSRSIMITGCITQGQFVSYRVVFKNKLELAAFILRYSDRCKTMQFSKILKYERRRYEQGPLA